MRTQRRPGLIGFGFAQHNIVNIRTILIIGALRYLTSGQRYLHMNLNEALRGILLNPEQITGDPWIE